MEAQEDYRSGLVVHYLQVVQEDHLPPRDGLVVVQRGGALEMLVLARTLGFGRAAGWIRAPLSLRSL